jgi:hypothetical protein
MPAESTAQREVMAIAEHHPEKLHAENRGLLSMSHSQLHDFAATSEKHLPEHVKPSGQHAHASYKMAHKK